MKQVFLITLAVCLITGCKKNNDVKPITEVPIGSQTLAETRATFQGTWKLHYSMGGYSGSVRVDYPNTILNFTATDSLYRWDDNLQTINSKVNYTNADVYISNYSTFILEIEYPNNLMLSHQIAYKRKGDTLILGQPTSQPHYLYLTKQ